MSSPEKTTNNNDRYDEIKKLFDDHISKIDFGFFNHHLQDFYNLIKEKYPDEEYKNCLLWHLIIASTPDETVTEFDTPEGEIENFIRSKLPSFELEQ